MLDIEEYRRAGFQNRKEYLRRLAQDYGISFNRVAQVANLLGSEEDFDALITTLDDMSSMDL